VSRGDLLSILGTLGNHFDLETTKFYAAELVLAIEYYQSKFSVVHRDIKMANIMVSSKGHIRLGDFGIAKHLEPMERYQKKRTTFKTNPLWLIFQ